MSRLHLRWLESTQLDWEPNMLYLSLFFIGGLQICAESTKKVCTMHSAILQPPGSKQYVRESLGGFRREIKGYHAAGTLPKSFLLIFTCHLVDGRWKNIKGRVVQQEWIWRKNWENSLVLISNNIGISETAFPRLRDSPLGTGRQVTQRGRSLIVSLCISNKYVSQVNTIFHNLRSQPRSISKTYVVERQRARGLGKQEKWQVSLLRCRRVAKWAIASFSFFTPPLRLSYKWGSWSSSKVWWGNVWNFVVTPLRNSSLKRLLSKP